MIKQEVLAKPRGQHTDFENVCLVERPLLLWAYSLCSDITLGTGVLGLVSSSWRPDRNNKNQWKTATTLVCGKTGPS